MIKDHYYLGVDIGGSNSRAMITNSNGDVLGFGATGPGNWEAVGYHGLELALLEIMRQALGEASLRAEDISGAGFGMAGFDWPSQRQRHLEAIRVLGLTCPVEVVNDATLGLLAGSSSGWGVSVVSGTGCNCRGWNKDRSVEGRAVGGATEWSDEGTGAYQVVLRALRAVSFEWTRRGQKTALTRAFMEKFGVDNLGRMMEGLYLGQYQPDSLDALMVFRIAHEGDPAAVEVVRWAGKKLGDMACGVIRQLDFEDVNFDVVLIGSLYDGHPLIIESMRETILKVAPYARLVRLDAPPVVGGVLLGMEVAGYDFIATRPNLISSAKAMLKKRYPGIAVKQPLQDQD